MVDTSQGCLKFASWFPVIITHGIIVFCYVFYMWTFLIPLVFGYDLFQGSDVDDDVSSGFFLQNIVYYDDKINSFLGVQTTVQLQRKGLFLFVIIHMLFILFYISFVKTIDTQPGRIPKAWKDQIQKEIEEYLQSENQVIQSWKVEKKSQRSTNKNNIQTRFQRTAHEEVKPLQDTTHKDGGSEVNFDDQEEDLEIEIDDDFKLQLNIKARIQLLDKPGRRFCKRCLCMKPPRAHHCRQCQMCWLKMDHHCQFVNNCIGFKNYKYFLNLITYVTVALIIMVFTYTKPFIRYSKNRELTDLQLFLIILFYEFIWVLMIVLLGFTLFHYRYKKNTYHLKRILLQNKTTLECLEKKADAQRDEYNQGAIKNIQSVLGPSFTLWLVPAFPNLEGDGVQFG